MASHEALNVLWLALLRESDLAVVGALDAALGVRQPRNVHPLWRLGHLGSLRVNLLLHGSLNDNPLASLDGDLDLLRLERVHVETNSEATVAKVIELDRVLERVVLVPVAWANWDAAELGLVLVRPQWEVWHVHVHVRRHHVVHVHGRWHHVHVHVVHVRRCHHRLVVEGRWHVPGRREAREVAHTHQRRLATEAS